jgi:hypothetical protein
VAHCRGPAPECAGDWVDAHAEGRTGAERDAALGRTRPAELAVRQATDQLSALQLLHGCRYSLGTHAVMPDEDTEPGHPPARMVLGQSAGDPAREDPGVRPGRLVPAGSR